MTPEQFKQLVEIIDTKRLKVSDRSLHYKITEQIQNVLGPPLTPEQCQQLSNVAAIRVMEIL